ncbi:MAG: hypothetical protein AAF705_00065 [Bacteroidota bacterium]
MSKKRQAVVVIHGIGEQRPMKTLRSFVTTLLNYEKHIIDDKLDERTSWTKPDRISNSYELRKISSKGAYKKGSRTEKKRSTTHFYEYHWAANMRDTKWRHILGWFRGLMFRNPMQSNSVRLLILWVLLWFLSVAWSIFTLVLVLESVLFGPVVFKSLRVCEYFLFFIPFGLFIAHNFFIGYIGDAARYLRVDVDNIQQREIIRKNGVDLLKALHETEDYDRIVLVGHSLGSVIAYDIITYLWIDFNKTIKLNQKDGLKENAETKWLFPFDSVRANSNELEKVQAFSEKVGKGAFNEDDIDDLQEAQIGLWKKIQYERKSWLISDLVTLGSPLTHGKLLMADSEVDFSLRIEEREYPVSPPVLDGEDLTYPSGNGNSYLHHATPFAVTRWTNLYFRGDFIGGKLSPYFGPGIKDIEIAYIGGYVNKFNSLVNPLSHNRYWLTNSDFATIFEQKEFEAIRALYNSMRLNDIESGIYM